MNCLDFRRQLMAEPFTRHAELLEHRRTCQACQRFAGRMQHMETALQRAVETDIPEGLAARILLNQRLKSRSRYKLPWYWAVAASLLLTTSFIAGYYAIQVSPSLEKTVLAHIHEELHHLDDRKDLSLTALNAVLQPQGFTLTASPGTINYAGTCPIGEAQGAHLVIAASRAPVTVLFIPGKPRSFHGTVYDTRFQGVIIPVKDGSLAIIGEHPDDVEQMKQRLLSSLTFAS